MDTRWEENKLVGLIMVWLSLLFTHNSKDEYISMKIKRKTAWKKRNSEQALFILNEIPRYFSLLKQRLWVYRIRVSIRFKMIQLEHMSSILK